MKELPCQTCYYWQQQQAFQFKHRAILDYTTVATDILWRIKHNRDCCALRGLGRIFYEFVVQQYSLQNTIFVPVPSDNHSISMRGFDVIATLLSYYQQIIPTQHLFKTIPTAREKQHTKRRKERLIYKTMLWELNETVVISPECTIVIVDDVFTTGTTFYVGYQTLMRQGIKKIESLSLFRSSF